MEHNARQVLKSGTNASIRFAPSVSAPQRLVNVYLPALPPGDLGVNEVPLLEGQSVVAVKEEVDKGAEEVVLILPLLLLIVRLAPFAEYLGNTDLLCEPESFDIAGDTFFPLFFTAIEPPTAPPILPPMTMRLMRATRSQNNHGRKPAMRRFRVPSFSGYAVCDTHGAFG